MCFICILRVCVFNKAHSFSRKWSCISRKISFKQSAAAAKSLQSCPILCDLIEGSPPGSPIPGILQARTLEWVAISFSNAWKWKWKWSRVQLFVTPWTAAYQASPSMGFSRQEYWSGLPLPSPIYVAVISKYCQGPAYKYFRLWSYYGLCYNCSIILYSAIDST